MTFICTISSWKVGYLGSSLLSVLCCSESDFRLDLHSPRCSPSMPWCHLSMWRLVFLSLFHPPPLPPISAVVFLLLLIFFSIFYIEELHFCSSPCHNVHHNVLLRHHNSCFSDDFFWKLSVFLHHTPIFLGRQYHFISLIFSWKISLPVSTFDMLLKVVYTLQFC